MPIFRQLVGDHLTTSAFFSLTNSVANRLFCMFKRQPATNWSAISRKHIRDLCNFSAIFYFFSILKRSQHLCKQCSTSYRLFLITFLHYYQTLKSTKATFKTPEKVEMVTSMYRNVWDRRLTEIQQKSTLTIA